MNCERCHRPMRRTRIPIRICVRCKRNLAPSPTLMMWQAAKVELDNQNSLEEVAQVKEVC